MIRCPVAPLSVFMSSTPHFCLDPLEFNCHFRFSLLIPFIRASRGVFASKSSLAVSNPSDSRFANSEILTKRRPL
ncbi:unnamed protein product [Meloidogyne enterolobii]|uniref:Uncharacterized protein n=1 Tax=Meloidogyne enterolobii TaxID=390850 RepID=A0ACB1AFX8_MELEN